MKGKLNERKFCSVAFVNSICISCQLLVVISKCICTKWFPNPAMKLHDLRWSQLSAVLHRIDKFAYVAKRLLQLFTNLRWDTNNFVCICKKFRCSNVHVYCGDWINQFLFWVEPTIFIMNYQEENATFFLVERREENATCHLLFSESNMKG